MDLLIGMLLVSIIIFSPYYYYYYYYYPCSHLHARYNDNYIIESNCVSRVYSVAAILYLQFVLHVMLFRPWNMFCTFTLALSVVFVQCPIWLFFCISLISCFPVMLLRYCLSDFWNGSSCPYYYRYHFVFTFHIPWISIVRSSYFKFFSAFC